jgi:hypothetical protein
MEERRDILAWMRSTFWKHNKNRLAGKVVQELRSSDNPSRDTQTQLAEIPEKLVQGYSIPDATSEDARTQLAGIAGKALQELCSPNGTSGDVRTRLADTSSSLSRGISGQPYSLTYSPAAEKDQDTNLLTATATESGRTWRDVMLE